MNYYEKSLCMGLNPKILYIGHESKQKYIWYLTQSYNANITCAERNFRFRQGISYSPNDIIIYDAKGVYNNEVFGLMCNYCGLVSSQNNGLVVFAYKCSTSKKEHRIIFASSIDNFRTIKTFDGIFPIDNLLSFVVEHYNSLPKKNKTR